MVKVVNNRRVVKSRRGFRATGVPFQPRRLAVAVAVLALVSSGALGDPVEFSFDFVDRSGMAVGSANLIFDYSDPYASTIPFSAYQSGTTSGEEIAPIESFFVIDQGALEADRLEFVPVSETAYAVQRYGDLWALTHPSYDVLEAASPTSEGSYFEDLLTLSVNGTPVEGVSGAWSYFEPVQQCPPEATCEPYMNDGTFSIARTVPEGDPPVEPEPEPEPEPVPPEPEPEPVPPEPVPPEPVPPPQPAPPTQEEAQRIIDEAMQGIAINANTRSTAAVISTACPQAAPGTRFREDCTPVVLGALAPDGSVLDTQASVALATVTAEQSTVPLSSSRASLSSQAQNIATRLSALRAGATGLSVGGLAFETEGPEQWVLPAAFAMDYAAPVPSGGAASADDGSILANERLGVFVNGTVTSANKDATSNEDGYDVSGWALTGGVDYRFLDNAVAGLAVGYYKSTTDIDNSGGDLDTDGYSLSLYGTYYHGDQLYVDGIVTYGSNDYDQDRNIRYQVGPTRVNQVAKASYDGHQWSAAISAGYDLSSGAWTYGPVLRVEYVSASVDSYNERMSDRNANGGAWAARLGDLDQESLTSSLGANVSRAVSTGWGVVLPQLHLGWVHEYRDDAVAVNGSFIEDPTSSVFSITGDRPDSDYFNARFGVSAQFAGGTSAFLYYNKVFGYRDLDVDTFGAGVRLVF